MSKKTKPKQKPTPPKTPKTKGCCFSDGFDLLSCTGGKTIKWGQAVGKTGWQRRWWICSLWSNNIVPVLLKVMSFYEKWATAREDFCQGIERRVPSLPSCCRAGESTECYLHTEFRSQHMPHLFIEVLNISSISYLTKHINTLLHFRWCKWNNKWWFQSTDLLVWERRVAVLFSSAVQWSFCIPVKQVPYIILH